jgi:hypothetical protein
MAVRRRDAEHLTALKHAFETPNISDQEKHYLAIGFVSGLRASGNIAADRIREIGGIISDEFADLAYKIAQKD